MLTEVTVGKFYRMRNGNIVGPMRIWPDYVEQATGLPLYDCPQEKVYGHYWLQDGTHGEPYFGVRNNPDYDLVSEVK